MTKSNYTLDQLPELPVEALELGGKLEHAGREPVLTIRPRKLKPSDPPSAPVQAVKKCEFAVRKYLTQVTYPRVVCFPFNELFNETLQAVGRTDAIPLRENEADPEVIAKHVSFYKLTSHKGNKLAAPYFCSVRHGPWSALAFEEESCTQGVPNKWILVVVEIPEVVLHWFGFWEDIPSFPNLHVFKGDLHLVQEARLCCPGCRWCATTNSCIPQTVKCQDVTPI